MTLLQAIFLGLIQGITEFFPVSSSGHLMLFQKLLGLNHLENYIFFDLICHLGTLLAVGIIFFQDIKKAFLDKKLFFQVLIGTLPLFPMVFLLRPLKELFNKIEYLGFFFLLTACILYLGERFKVRQTSGKNYRDALKIGCMQTLALMPGVSRSGSTISGAKVLGWSTSHAITFSFLLSIPAILGAVVLEVKELLKGGYATYCDPIVCAVGFITAFITGYIALKCLIRIAIRDKFKIFIWYCAGIGFLTLLLYH